MEVKDHISGFVLSLKVSCENNSFCSNCIVFLGHRLFDPSQASCSPADGNVVLIWESLSGEAQVTLCEAFLLIGDFYKPI